jgi:hypothetical protein
MGTAFKSGILFKKRVNRICQPEPSFVWYFASMFSVHHLEGWSTLLSSMTLSLTQQDILVVVALVGDAPSNK